MSNLKKQKSSLKNLIKRIREIDVNLKSLDVPYTALKSESENQMERKESSSLWGNARVPHGYFAVYVGKEKQRFVIPTAYLSHPLLLMLLKKTEEEYGFHQREGLAVPCDVETFENAMFAIHTSNSCM